LDRLTARSWALKDELRVLTNLRSDLLKTIEQRPHRTEELQADIAHFDERIAAIKEEIAAVEAERKALAE
jgi:uncharacterized small protein (DUF1192 family)